MYIEDHCRAIDPMKIHTELGWLPETKFADRIQKTTEWYLRNKPWWETIISGEHMHYYEKIYGNRCFSVDFPIMKVFLDIPRLRAYNHRRGQVSFFSSINVH